MRVLVIGGTGRLGRDICQSLASRGIEYRGVGSAELDITDQHAVHTYIKKTYPCDVVVLAAALVGLEKLEADKQRAYLVNSTGAKWVADACKDSDAKLVFISTDYVYDGNTDRPYKETDIPNAQNTYGKTKIEAEEYIKKTLEKYFILRVAWLFSDAGGDYLDSVVNAVEKGMDFPAIMVRRACATYTRDIADRVCEFILTNKYGIYNVVNEKGCSQEELCDEVQRLMNKKINLLPQILPEGFVTRPKDTRLCTKKMRDAGFTPMPSWENAVERCLKNRGKI